MGPAPAAPAPPPAVAPSPEAVLTQHFEDNADREVELPADPNAVPAVRPTRYYQNLATKTSEQIDKIRTLCLGAEHQAQKARIDAEARLPRLSGGDPTSHVPDREAR